MTKKTLANVPTNKDVDAFLETVRPLKRKCEAIELRRIIQDQTGLKAKIWGASIVGFGEYEYQRKNGESYLWFNVGISPGKKHLTLYVMFDLSGAKELLAQLGPHEHGRGCLYIKSLDQIDITILKEIIRRSDRWKR